MSHRSEEGRLDLRNFAISGALRGNSPVYKRTLPIAGSNYFGFIHRLESANKVSTCVVFLAKPR